MEQVICWSKDRGLSKAESAVFAHMCEGESTRGIAAKLFISPATVRTHVEAILRKLEVSTRLQAVVLARKGLYGS